MTLRARRLLVAALALAGFACGRDPAPAPEARVEAPERPNPRAEWNPREANPAWLESLLLGLSGSAAALDLDLAAAPGRFPGAVSREGE